jgi:DNA-binding CsgD family transcriptional regulator
MLSASAIHIPALIEMARRRWDLVGPLMTRALEGWRGVGARSEEAATLVTLSNCAQASGDLPLAAARAEEALAIYRTLGHTAGEFNALCRSARVAYERGDDMAAAAAYEAGLRLWTGLDERWSRAARFDDESRSMEGGPFPRWVCVDNAWSLMGALSGLARIAAAHGRSEQAATLVGAVDRLGTPLTSLSDEAAQAALAALGEARFTELRATGRALSLTAAVAMALSAVPHARRHDGAPTHGLTPREVEVLRLLVDGHSDREIAGLLFISRHTAANHVASILGKLALHSRAAAAAYAVRHGLD